MEYLNKEKTYGEFIKELRLRSQMSQKELGRKLSLSFQAISRYENNKINIDIFQVGKLCQIFNVDVSSFLKKEDKCTNNLALNHNFDYLKFINSLSYYREKELISLKSLGNKIGISPTKLSKIENNETLIKIDEFIKLADYFKVDYSLFYFGLNSFDEEKGEGNKENIVEAKKKNDSKFISLIKKHPIYITLASLFTISLITLGTLLPLGLSKPNENIDSYFEYIENRNGSLEITGIDKEKIIDLEELTIPSKINEKEVSTISSYAFNFLPNLKRIIVEEGINIISSFAFTNLPLLEEIVLPSSLIQYQSFGLSNTPNLKTINLSEYNNNLKVYEGDLYTYDLSTLLKVVNYDKSSIYHIKEGVNIIYTGAFDSLNNINEIIFSSSVRKVNCNAFVYLDNLTKVELNEGLNELSFASFLECNNYLFNSITLPSSLAKLEGNPFLHMPNLNNISINSSNPNFKINEEENMLTSIDNKTLYYIFNLDSSKINDNKYILPTFIETLTKGSIDVLDDNINELVIPSNISYVDSFSIQNISSLDYIYIEEGSSNFKKNAITNMDKDTVVALEESSLPSSFDESFYEGKVIYGADIPSFS